MQTTPTAMGPIKSAQLLDAIHWQSTMGRLKDPVVARLVLGYLNENPRLRDQHPGAYLMASETVKRSQIRYAKARAWGRVASHLGRAGALLLIQSIHYAATAFQWCLRGGRSIAQRLRSPRPATATELPAREAGATIVQLHRCPVRERRSAVLHKQRIRA